MPENIAVVRCPSCKKVQSSQVKFCPACGANMATGDKPQQQTIVVEHKPLWSPGVAAVLSFFIPGAGQVYKGKVLGGLVWFFFVVVGYAILVIPGIILHLICIFNAASGTPKESAPSTSPAS